MGLKYWGAVVIGLFLFGVIFSGCESTVKRVKATDEWLRENAW